MLIQVLKVCEILVLNKLKNSQSKADTISFFFQDRDKISLVETFDAFFFKNQSCVHHYSYTLNCATFRPIDYLLQGSEHLYYFMATILIIFSFKNATCCVLYPFTADKIIIITRGPKPGFQGCRT